MHLYGNEAGAYITDEYSLFYFRFMEQYRHQEKSQWILMQASSGYISWCGYAFENICLKHIFQIKKALEIGGVQSTESAWSFTGTKEKAGAQIDLLIDRADQTITVCEIKFSIKPFVINKTYATELRRKIEVFRQHSAMSKTIMTAFISTYRIERNDYAEELTDNVITMNELFT